MIIAHLFAANWGYTASRTNRIRFFWSNSSGKKRCNLQ